MERRLRLGPFQNDGRAAALIPRWGETQPFLVGDVLPVVGAVGGRSGKAMVVHVLRGLFWFGPPPFGKGSGKGGG